MEKKAKTKLTYLFIKINYIINSYSNWVMYKLKSNTYFVLIYKQKL